MEAPAGWEVWGAFTEQTKSSPGGWPLAAGAERRAVVELSRAKVQLAVSRELLHQQRTDGPALASAQRRFARGCWLAKLALQAGASPLRRVLPDGPTLAEWLEQLQQQNKALIAEHHLEAVGKEAVRQVHEAGVSEPAPTDQSAQGTPMSWVAERDGAAPAVRLAPSGERQFRQSLSFSGQWLIVLLAVWTVTLSGSLRRLMGWLWPEQMTLLGVLGWQVAGPTMVVLCLVALGVVGRVLLTVRGVRELLPPPQRSSHSSAERDRVQSRCGVPRVRMVLAHSELVYTIPLSCTEFLCRFLCKPYTPPQATMSTESLPRSSETLTLQPLRPGELVGAEPHRLSWLWDGYLGRERSRP